MVSFGNVELIFISFYFGVLYEKWCIKKGENVVWEGKRMLVYRCFFVFCRKLFFLLDYLGFILINLMFGIKGYIFSSKYFILMGFFYFFVFKIIEILN